MRKSLSFLLALTSVAFLTGCAPDVAIMKSGSLSFLVSQKQVNVEYDYSDMRVGKFPREADYLAPRVAEMNAKEPGRGDQWRNAWIDDRARRFQPKFEMLLNDMVSNGKLDVNFGNYPNAEYTLIFKTTFTEPGWNVGIMRHPAFIDGEAAFVSTQNRQNRVAVVGITKSPGADAWGFDFETGQRIEESYAKAGKELGKLISKKLKK
ncbi:MAG: hypothetical protein JNK85_10610 [Verrucomicrobiales bacterium]|nr:hypothetical protein [Verrucomicrobiales bacterium]